MKFQASLIFLWIQVIICIRKILSPLGMDILTCLPQGHTSWAQCVVIIIDLMRMLFVVSWVDMQVDSKWVDEEFLYLDYFYWLLLGFCFYSYKIKFIVDGTWRIDPDREITTSCGFTNNVLRVDRWAISSISITSTKVLLHFCCSIEVTIIVICFQVECVICF